MCASYLPAPVIVSESVQEESRNESRKKAKDDPFYAAMLGEKRDATSASLEDGVPISTLDEPISATLKRDVHMVYNKTWMILGLKDPHVSLRDWDLWGPLINSLLIAVSLASSVVNFTTAFTFIWLGALLVIVNARLLGYRLAPLPSVAFMGYCLGPMMVTGVLTATLVPFFLLRMVLVGAAAGWGTLAALVLLEIDPALEDRRLLAAFPVALYFVVLAWFFFII